MTRIRAPLGLIGFLTLVGAIETGVQRYRLRLEPTVVSGYRFASEAVRETSECEVLCFGDSLVKFGVYPRALVGRDHRAYNLACPAARPPWTSILFQRALDAGARPSAVVVDFKPTLAQTDPLLDAGELSEVLTAGEILDLAVTARDPVGLARIGVHKLLPSFHARDGLRALASSTIGRRPRRRGHELIPLWRRNWEENLGAWVVDKNPDAGRPARFADETIANALGPWECHPLNAASIRRFLETASRAGIPVYWLVPPILPRLQAERDRRGDDARFSTFVRSIAADYTDLVVVDGRRSGYPASVFIDGSHLDFEGAHTFTVELAAILRAHRRLNSLPRLVTLPPFRSRIPTEALAARRRATE